MFSSLLTSVVEFSSGLKSAGDERVFDLTGQNTGIGTAVNAAV